MRVRMEWLTCTWLGKMTHRCLGAYHRKCHAGRLATSALRSSHRLAQSHRHYRRRWVTRDAGMKYYSQASKPQVSKLTCAQSQYYLFLYINFYISSFGSDECCAATTQLAKKDFAHKQRLEPVMQHTIELTSTILGGEPLV